MGVDEVSIQYQSVFAFSDALRRALGGYLDKSQVHMAKRVVPDR